MNSVTRYVLQVLNAIFYTFKGMPNKEQILKELKKRKSHYYKKTDFKV